VKRLWYIFMPVLAVQISLAYFNQNNRPEIRRPAPERITPAAVPRGVKAGAILRTRSRLDPAFTVDVGDKSNSTGTAFSIRDDGAWFTARHVVDGRDQIGLRVGPCIAVKVQRVLTHPSADIAVIWTGSGKPAISIARDKLRLNQSGYHVGYPEG
jgi:serine protease Do